MARLRRFRFSGLPKLSRRDAAVTNALLAHLPQAPFSQAFKDELRGFLGPFLRVDVDIWVDSFQTVSSDELAGLLPRPTALAVIGLPPKPYTVLLEVDLPLAQQAVDRMLGGPGEECDAARPLSEIENGVFSFLLVKLLSLAQPTVGDEQQATLKLLSLVNRPEDLEGKVDLGGEWVAVNFKLFFDVTVSYARLLVPAAMVRSDFVAPVPTAGPAWERYKKALLGGLERMDAQPVPLSIQAGRSILAAEDLDALDEEDIILLEETGVALQDGVPGGAVTCTLGAGRCGQIQGTLGVLENGRFGVQVDQITALETPESLAHFRDDLENAPMEHARVMSGAPLFADGAADASKHALARAIRSAIAARPFETHRVPHPMPTGASTPHQGEEHMDDAYEAEDNLAETEGLLGDIKVPLVVELGRVDVTASDVARLRPGQVIELSRGPGDPVDLVVEGRAIGKGELVEVDGELGVRLLSLVR